MYRTTTLTGVVTWWQEFWTFQQMYPIEPQHKLPSKHRPSTLWMLFAPEMKTNLHQPNAGLSKKLRELVDRENLDPRRSFTKKRYWNQQQFQKLLAVYGNLNPLVFIHYSSSSLRKRNKNASLSTQTKTNNKKWYRCDQKRSTGKV